MNFQIRAGFVKDGYVLATNIGLGASELYYQLHDYLEEKEIGMAMLSISAAACSKNLCLIVPDNLKNLGKFLFGMSLAMNTQKRPLLCD